MVPRAKEEGKRTGPARPSPWGSKPSTSQIATGAGGRKDKIKKTKSQKNTNSEGFIFRKTSSNQAASGESWKDIKARFSLETTAITKKSQTKWGLKGGGGASREPFVTKTRGAEKAGKKQKEGGAGAFFCKLLQARFSIPDFSATESGAGKNLLTSFGE